MSEPESFYAMRRVDGEPIGEFSWVEAVGPDDWTYADDSANDPAEFEIVRMVVVPVARRWFGVHEFVPCDDDPDECDECSADRDSDAHRPAVAVRQVGSAPHSLVRRGASGSRETAMSTRSGQ